MFTEKRILIGLQGIIALIYSMAGLACISGGMTAELERLGYPQYFPMILGPAYLLSVVSLYQKQYPFLKEWAIAGIAINLIGASASHILAGDTIVQAMPSFAIQVLFVWFYVLYLKDQKKKPLVAEISK